MDVQILNEKAVDATCNDIRSSSLPQLSSSIDNLTNVLGQIKNTWNSTGMDKESYVLELEKQCRNLNAVSNAISQLVASISGYSSNVQAISSSTVDVVIGGGYQGNASHAYNTAGNAVRGNNPLPIATDYVNKDSTIDSFAIVNSDGSLGATSSAEGLSVADFAAQNNVSTDNVAVIVGKNDTPQIWVPAEDLMS